MNGSLNLKLVSLSVAFLSVGGALGYWLGTTNDAAVSSESSDASDSAEVVSARRSRDDAQERLRKLRQRVAELERQLSRRESQTEKAVSNDVPPAVAAAPLERSRGNPGEWLENLRQTDPARYTQMTNRFANWRQQRKNQARSRMDFLSSVDTSHMSKSAQETHQALQDLIAQCEELESRLHRPDISSDERHQILNELRSSHHEMRRLNGAERQNLLSETVRVLGFSGEDATEITATLQEVIQATDSGFDRGPGGFGPPPGGHRPGNGR